MRLRGRIYKDGKFWLAEIPILDAMTQGSTKREAFEMVVDMLQTMANDTGFEVEVMPRGRDAFEVGSPNIRIMISLLLRRARERSGRSLAEMREVLGASSRNAYARYEQGSAVPSVEKFFDLWHAACPDSDLVLDEERIPGRS